MPTPLPGIGPAARRAGAGLAVAAIVLAAPAMAAETALDCAALQLRINAIERSLGPKDLAAANAELAACRQRVARIEAEQAAAAANPESPKLPAFPAGFTGKFQGKLNAGGTTLRVIAAISQATANGPAQGVLTEKEGARRSHEFVIGKTADDKCRLLFAADGLLPLRSLVGGCVLVEIQAVAPDRSAGLQLYRSFAP